MPVRIGIMNDTHIRETNPGSRKDDFIVSLMKKYLETGLIIDQYNIDLLVHTGDMFDGPRIDNEVSGLFAEIMKTYSCPMVVVPGNHDIFGYTMSNINKTTLGLLAKAGVFDLLTRGNPVTINKDGVTVSIQGQEFTPEVDSTPDMYMVDVDPSADYHVLAVHGAVLDKPGPPKMDYVLVDDIPASPTPYPVIICAGHYHPGFKARQSKNNPFVINNGSVGRDSVSAKHMPGLTILEFETGGWNHKFIQYKSAQAFDDVFNTSAGTQKKAKQNFLTNFRQSLANTSSFKPVDVMKILTEKAGKAGYLQACLKAINEADALHAKITQKLTGYADCGYSKRIARIEVENFMSHGHTVIDLDPYTNMFVGPSNNGKSAIIRAIRWACFDDPKGTDFIKLGESRARVKIEYDDGTWIERERTRSSAGTLKVYDGNQLHEFTKFSKALPIELPNVHQMPDIQLTKDKRINISVSEQLDAPFMLSESPGTRAATIGTLAGLDAFDIAIRENAKQVLGIQKGIKEKEKIIENLKKQLDDFTDLPVLETRIAQATMGLNVIDSLTKQVEEIDVLTRDFYTLGASIKVVEDQLTQVRRIDTIALLAMLDEADKLDVEVTELDQMIAEQTRLDNGIANLQATLTGLPKTDGLIDWLDSAINLDIEVDMLTGFIKEGQDLDWQIKHITRDLSEIPNVQGLQHFLDEADRLNEQVIELDSLVNDAGTLKANIDAVTKQLNAVRTAFKTATDNYVTALRQAKVCPECFSTLDDMRITQILDNVTGGR